MVRSAFVAWMVVGVVACSVDASSPGVHPDERVGIASNGGGTGAVALAGTQFAAFPPSAGGFSSLSFAADGSFTGSLVLSCAGAACAQPTVAAVTGTFAQPGKSAQVHLSATKVSVPPGAAFACPGVKDWVQKPQKVDFTQSGATGSLALAGSSLCGGGASLEQATAAPVPTSGGSVSSPDGQVTVSVQPFGVPPNTSITIAASPGAPVPTNAAPAGTAYAFGPEGQTFPRPITITLPVDPTKLPSGKTVNDVRVFTAPVGGTSYVAMPTQVVDATHVSVSTSHFSVYVAGLPTDCTQENAHQTTGAMQPYQPPTTQPVVFAGIDLSNGGGDYNGGTSGTNFGATIEDIDPNGCFGHPAPSGLGPGLLNVTDPTTSLSIDYNEQSHVVYVAAIGAPPFQGPFTFTSRDGAHSYAIRVGGGITKDGQPFTIDWSAPTGSFGEIEDAILATYLPSSTPSSNCQQDGTCLYLPDDGAGNSIMGVRAVHFYVMFTQGTSNVNTYYTFWLGGTPLHCQTPDALAQYLVAASIQPYYAGNGTIGFGPIGGIPMAPGGVAATFDQLGIAGCGTPVVPAPDGSRYKAVSWGYGGEVVLEYDAASPHDDYRLFANAGYGGSLQFSYVDWSTYEDLADYVIAVGSQIQVTPQPGGTQGPFAIDWTTNPTDPPQVTTLANAIDQWFSPPSYFGVDDPDCLSAGHCTVVPDDGHGHHVIGFPLVQLYFVIDATTNAVTQIYAEDPASQ